MADGSAGRPTFFGGEMAQDMNSVSIVGRLTRDAEIKTLPSGTEIAEISIASNWSRKVGDEWKEEVGYFDVTKFKPGGLARYLVKGKQIGVKGELQQQRWENSEGQKRSRVKIIAQQLQLLGGKSDAGISGANDYGTRPGDVGYSGSDFEDDVPF